MRGQSISGKDITTFIETGMCCIYGNESTKLHSSFQEDSIKCNKNTGWHQHINIKQIHILKEIQVQMCMST